MTATDPAFDAIISRLREQTGAGRTTLRLEDDDGGFPIVAEAVAAGVPTLRDGDVGDLREALTFQALVRDRRPLIQGDLLNDDPAPPAALIEVYGARAQMLSPLLGADGQVIGVISVHEVRGPREWTAADVGLLEDATTQVTALLPAPGAGRG